MGIPQILRSPQRRGNAVPRSDSRQRRQLSGRPGAGSGIGASILGLQRSVGNAYTSSMLRAHLNDAGRFGRSASRDAGGADVSPLVRAAMQVPGKPLTSSERSVMDVGARSSLSDVRIHEGGLAALSADLMGASAYAFGRHVVFGSGQSARNTSLGRQLLFHELAHVRKNRPNSSSAEAPQRAVLAPAHSAEEREAAAAAKAEQSQTKSSAASVSDSALAPAKAASGAGGGAAVVHRSILGDVLGTVAGGLAGAALGFLAGGPIGAVVGGVLGGATGLLAGEAATAGQRPLTAPEASAAKLVFGKSLDLDRVRVAESPLFGIGSTARTPFETVYFPPNAQKQPGYLSWLIHELTHVWQTQHGISVFTKAVTAMRGASAYVYGDEAQLRKDAAAGKKFTDYNTEQQADILRDYYDALTAGADVSAYEPFVAQMRGAH